MYETPVILNFSFFGLSLRFFCQNLSRSTRIASSCDASASAKLSPTPYMMISSVLTSRFSNPSSVAFSHPSNSSGSEAIPNGMHFHLYLPRGGGGGGTTVFNGTSTPKGSYSAKAGDNDCNVNSSRYSLGTALHESIRYQAKSEQNVRQDLTPRVRHGEAALMHPTSRRVCRS